MADIWEVKLWINIPSKSKPIKEDMKKGLRKAQREASLSGYMQIVAKLSVRLAARAKLNSTERAKPFLIMNKIIAIIVAV